ncbi:hypothetical protein BCR39DRAFT_379483 [Naematelia encephala]|uniref:C2H2-type domain-containing protein n=1 Tax=Naematelia encephala TaxID=71784 RepID=A0A1Y2BD22_9TREE|nr:hypothetical protein BCR39DRAFT_379483 [Naematelia encephala]
MDYRSYSNESQRPQQPSLSRTPSMSMNNAPAQGSPLASPYQRQVSNGYPSPHAQSPQRPNVYPQQYYSSGSYPSSADMPRSMSYPSTYAPPYSYLPSMSAAPMHQGGGLPPLARHNTTGAMEGGIPGMDRPSLGYSFANRLPLVDRPFKCDECVQSFNRNHDLKRHKRIHLSVKPFGCDKCGKTFSRKDALRRHWLVKGCRGEDGATAPILPMFPLNSNPPALSPPSPPGNVSPSDHAHSGPSYHPSSFSHPAAPPPLNTLPMRQASDQSQIIVTPNDVANQSMRAEIAGPMDEPMVVDSTMSGPHAGSGRGSGSSMADSNGYFEGVVGLKHDGTALIDNQAGTPNSPYSKYSTSPHPYRRPNGVASPHRSQPSPSYGSRTPNGPDQLGKPIFAMPFTPSGQHYHSQDGMLAPPHESIRMEKQHSTESAPESWQRW